MLFGGSMTDVRIDHDITFSDYDTEYLKHWLSRVPYPITKVYIRSSCGGNTHVKVSVPIELSPLDELLIRAILRDDARRIRGDLERYALNSKVFGLLFDTKIDEEHRVYYAGIWIDISMFVLDENKNDTFIM